MTPELLHAIRLRHHAETIGDVELCAICVMAWPCDTVLVLADLDKLSATVVFAYEAGAADQRARAREEVT